VSAKDKDQDLTPLLVLANHHSNIGKWSEAESEYTKALLKVDDLNRPRVLAMLACARMKCGKTDLGQQAMNQALKLANQPGVDKINMVPPLLEVARVYYGQDNWIDAQKAFNSIIKIAGGGSTSHLLSECVEGSANCAIHLQQYDEAERLFLQSLELIKKSRGANDPEVAFKYANLGDVYCCRKDFDRGIESYLKARAMLQNHPEQKYVLISVVERLIRVYEATGKNAKVEEMKKELSQLRGA
jgi:tetratricopeptide (TPR) repeat protein